MRDDAQALGADDLQRSLQGLRFPADWEARFEAASMAPRVQHFIVSAFVDVRMTVDAMRLGVDDVLPKPASDESLIRAIERGAAALPAVPVRCG